MWKRQFNWWRLFLAACLIGLAPASEHVAEITTVSVRASHRRQGLGQRLLSHAIQCAASQGFKRLTLITLKDVLADAVRLYERNGFVTVSELVTPFYRVITMERDVVLAPAAP